METWSAREGDFGAGYRILEDVPVGGPEEVAGRTTGVTGTIEIDDTTLAAVDIEVAATDLDTGNQLRDRVAADGYLEVDSFPTASLRTTTPIDLAPLPDEGEAKEYLIEGDFELHGVTLLKTFTVQAQWRGAVIEMVGQTDITLTEFGIERPDLLGRTAHDEATIEFKVELARP